MITLLFCQKMVTYLSSELNSFLTYLGRAVNLTVPIKNVQTNFPSKYLYFE